MLYSLRRSWTLRVIAALVWCVALAAPPVNAPCPMAESHGGHSSRDDGAPDPAVTHNDATHHEHAAHPAQTPDHARAEPSQAPSHAPTHSTSHSGCVCLSHCCATAAPAGVGAPHIGATIAHRATLAVVYHAARPLAARHDHLLPFAVGPPRRA
ncbi:MAG: hypothetical protein IT353_18865 [Gemmatimonadaceae bacterium]|nr:hypothetical protein [Gemmatimonadaceae bacterium]